MCTTMYDNVFSGCPEQRFNSDRFFDSDFESIIREIESMRMSDKRVLQTAFAVLLLNPKLLGLLIDAYQKAVIRASRETEIDKTYPAVYPWSFEEMVNSIFYPD